MYQTCRDEGIRLGLIAAFPVNIVDADGNRTDWNTGIVLRALEHAGIDSAASLRLLAKSARQHMFEWSMAGSRLNTDLSTPRPQRGNGYVAIPTESRLGVAPDSGARARYRVP